MLHLLYFAPRFPKYLVLKSLVSELNSNFDNLNAKIGNVFSTDEVKTNDIWIDGKQIYRKVLNVSSLPNSTVLPIYHEISNMKEVVRLYGMAYYSGDAEGGGVTIPYTDSSNVNNSIEIRANLTSILIITKSNKSSMRGTIVIEYTKM